MIINHKGAQPSITSSLGALMLITSTASGSLFLQLFSAYPILEQLSTHLSIADIVALTRTHRELINVYKDLEANRWKVDQTLRRFVSNAARFRSQMAKHNALVFGSIPLQFFERVVWEESDMDILIRGKKDADAFGTYLSTLEGYQVKTYVKRELVDGAAKKKVMIIQIVCCENEPISAILRSHTTVVVNFFSWNKAYALYPLSTMIHHEGHMLRAPGSHYNDPGVEAEILVKYAERGWKLLDVAWPEERHLSINRQIRNSSRGEHQDVARPRERKPLTNHPIRNSRRVGDKYSWIIPFDTTYVEDSETPDYVLEYAVFTLKKGFSSTSESLDQGKVKFYLVGLKPYAAATLCYRYTFGNWYWIAFLESKLASKVHERPLLENPGYVRPDGWTYWDDYVPDFYWAWEKSKTKKKTSAVAESSGKNV